MKNLYEKAEEENEIASIADSSNKQRYLSEKYQSQLLLKFQYICYEEQLVKKLYAKMKTFCNDRDHNIGFFSKSNTLVVIYKDSEGKCTLSRAIIIKNRHL